MRGPQAMTPDISSGVETRIGGSPGGDGSADGAASSGAALSPIWGKGDS